MTLARRGCRAQQLLLHPCLFRHSTCANALKYTVMHCDALVRYSTDCNTLHCFDTALTKLLSGPITRKGVHVGNAQTRLQCPDRPSFTAQAHRTTYVSINLDCTSYSDQTAWDFTATQTALLSTPRAGHQPIFALFGHFLDQRLYSTVLHNITSSSLHFAQFGSVLKFVACQRWPSSGACVQINIRFE